MPGLTMIVMAAGLLGTLLLAAAAFAGPSASKLQARRLESVRERHSRSSEVAAQAQLKRIFAHRQTKADGFTQQFIPNPALLRRRLEIAQAKWGQEGRAQRANRDDNVIRTAIELLQNAGKYGSGVAHEEVPSALDRASACRASSESG